jgi:hypothetical protein
MLAARHLSDALVSQIAIRADHRVGFDPRLVRCSPGRSSASPDRQTRDAT